VNRIRNLLEDKPEYVSIPPTQESPTLLLENSFLELLFLGLVLCPDWSEGGVMGSGLKVGVRGYG
jgi:hypothetical protein